MMCELLSVYPNCIFSHRASSLLSFHSIMFHIFFFNDPPTTEIYTLSLHDALPISVGQLHHHAAAIVGVGQPLHEPGLLQRSEEHTSELQSPDHLVCRLLLEKKKKYHKIIFIESRPFSRKRSRPLLKNYRGRCMESS